MRKVTYTDQEGYLRTRLVRDNDPDEAAPLGIPCDPPDLDQIDWPAVKRDLHNLLAARGLFTLSDIQRTQSNLRSAILDVTFRRLLALYTDKS